MNRTNIINHLIKKYNYKSYLEIGVYHYGNFDRVVCNTKHCVDPIYDATYKVTSDEFFERHISQKYDIVFIDGLHLVEQVIKDIDNSLYYLNDGGTLVLHDCNPPTRHHQIREFDGISKWNGDVWKAIYHFRTTRDGLNIRVVDTDWGCGIIQIGEQTLFPNYGKYQDIDYELLESNRKELLNLVSIDEFLKAYQ